MYSIYVLKNSKSNQIYIGFTNDLKRRFLEHNNNESGFTKNKGQWKLVYCEIFCSKKDALNREKKLKQHGSLFGHLRKRISNSLNEG